MKTREEIERDVTGPNERNGGLIEPHATQIGLLLDIRDLLTPRATTVEQLIAEAGYLLREITFHTDGRIIAKTGSSAPHPKKLYSGKTVTEALQKLINDNI